MNCSVGQTGDPEDAHLRLNGGTAPVAICPLEGTLLRELAHDICRERDERATLRS